MRFGWSPPNIGVLRVEIDLARRSRAEFGRVAGYMGNERRAYETSAAAMRASGIIEIFRRHVMVLLDEDSKQVKATDAAVQSLGGEAQAWELFFSNWASGMRDALANESREQVRAVKMVIEEVE